MSRNDWLGLSLACVVLWALMIACHAQFRGTAVKTECSAHLKNLYWAYEAFSSERGAPITEVSARLGGTKELVLDPAAVASHFRVLCSNGISFKQLVCPLDSRKAAPSLSALSAHNISYFISVASQDEADRRILAGNRNIAPAGTILRQTNSVLRWREEMGLHGSYGYILLYDGTVKAMDNDGLKSLSTNRENQANIFAVP